MEPTGTDMIVVRDAKFSFRSKKVLCSLNMTVKKKSIYGLLGPSSCGKTTLLNCILGLKKLDSGYVDVKIANRREIGYMPQEIALFDNFTLEETCHFFGTFYGLPEDIIRKRTYYLKEFLSLEGCQGRSIVECSGGQQRRISFLIALLQDPKLLILDEPTVGMDCLLSEKIWQHLTKLSNEGKTIIITTHYIQEAKNCNMIGLMRHGKLLEERTPHELMLQHRTTNLENIFLEVCQKQEHLQEKISQKFDPPRTPVEKESKLYPDSTSFDKHRFKALLYKNLLWFKRYPISTFELIFLPLFLSTLYGNVLGNPQGLKVGLYSAEFPSDLGPGVCLGQPDLTWRNGLNCSLPRYLTCGYLKELEKFDITIVNYNNREDLKRDIDKNKIWGSLEVPRDFSSALEARIESPIMTSNTSKINSSFIVSRLDGTNHIIKFMLTRSMKTAMERFYRSILVSCGMPENVQAIPIAFNKPLHGPSEPNLGQNALPGFLCAFCFHFTLLYTSGALMTEKRTGVFGRNIAGGMTYLEVIAAHLVMQVVVMMLQNVIMFSNFYGVLGYAFAGSIGLTILLALALNFTGISFGFLLTEVFSSEILICFAGIGATVSIFVTGGLIWPQEGMHPILANVHSFIPVSGVTSAMSSLTERGFGLTHPTVVTGFLNSAAWTTVFTLSSVLVHKLNVVV